MPSTKLTLEMHWTFTFATFVVIGTRLALRKWPPPKMPTVWTGMMASFRVPPPSWDPSFDAGDFLSIAAAFCLLVCLPLVHFILSWGTNNVSDARRAQGFSPEEVYAREVGSKLLLADRAIYNTYLWIQKFVMLDLYRHLFRNQWIEKPIVWSFSTIFAISYVAITNISFQECKPFHLHWQVEPDPGTCAHAQRQLIVPGALNLFTETMLLVTPIWFVFFSMRKAGWKRKIQLLCLFALGIFLLGMTAAKMAIGNHNPDSENHRSVWTSGEMLTTSVVVNAPTTYGLWNKRRARRQASRKGSASTEAGAGLVAGLGLASPTSPARGDWPTEGAGGFREMRRNSLYGGRDGRGMDGGGRQGRRRGSEDLELGSDDGEVV